VVIPDTRNTETKMYESANKAPVLFNIRIKAAQSQGTCKQQYAVVSLLWYFSAVEGQKVIPHPAPLSPGISTA